MTAIDLPIESVEYFSHPLIGSLNPQEICMVNRLNAYFSVLKDMPLRTILFRHHVLLLHVSFWILYFSFRLYDVTEHLALERAVLYIGLPMIFNILASYIHYIFILPILFKDKKWIKYFLLLLILLSIIISLRILTENEIFAPLTKNEDYFKTLKLTRVVSTIWDTLTFLVFTGMIRFVLDWFELENKRKQLENEKLNAELNYLKSQINPHFLFNTLHNLNSLVYAGARNANEVIIKLSNIMRYMIYESSKERVTLSSEIDYMNDYIHLESIRLNNSFRLDFKIEGPVEQVQLAPLMLITFLENAFKHGVSDQEADCWIDVRLTVRERQLQYHVSNKKINVKQNKLKSGFGLNNVKKRLELSYPDKYTLLVNDQEDSYSIDLTIRLA